MTTQEINYSPSVPVRSENGKTIRTWTQGIRVGNELKTLKKEFYLYYVVHAKLNGRWGKAVCNTIDDACARLTDWQNKVSEKYGIEYWFKNNQIYTHIPNTAYAAFGRDHTTAQVYIVEETYKDSLISEVIE